MDAKGERNEPRAEDTVQQYRIPEACDPQDAGLIERRKQQLCNITDEIAVRMYDQLCADYERQYGEMSEGAQCIIGDIATMEQTKRALAADIHKRGAVEEFRNGRQHFWRENKSIAAFRALAEQQRKHLNELKLTPSSQRLNYETLKDDFNDF